MDSDRIKTVRIDDSGRLCIYPEKEQFTLIWRTATEVHWDNKESFLYSPKPREWSYLDWFNHMVRVVKDECNCMLELSEDTLWINIPLSLKNQIIKE